MRLVQINGKKVSDTDVSLLSDGGFYYGSRAMTTMLARGDLLVDFDRHMDRLVLHAEQLSLGELPRPDLIRFELDSLLDSLGRPEVARMRVILFRGADGTVMRLLDVATMDQTYLVPRLDGGAIRLNVSIDRSWPRGSQIKTGFLGERGVTLDRAKAAGFDDVLWVNGEGEVAEATWSNIFLIGRTGDLVEIATPPASSGLLLGIVRQRIIDLLTVSQIPVTERTIALEEIPRFDEAFLTSSVRGVCPVIQIDKHKLQSLRPQAVFRHISRLYQTWLESGGPSNFSRLKASDRS